MESIGLDGEISHFQSMDLLVIQISTSFLPKIFMDVHQDLSCGVDWSRWAKRLNFKVKRSQSR
ncbi:hypothetical protein H5410_056470 [Solanum commersonii]|uniref:Uncharacterized protein n=1 Tax=Solanum commersonii TaxID=4109 RepID=A0A9J5WMS4_SOLCO|nr:hypothetical protein H5410_056470 [Solanum commersonii]